MEMKIQHSEVLGCSKNSFKRAVHNNIGLPKEIRKISNKQSNITPKRTGKRRTNKLQRQQKKGDNKIRMEINEIEPPSPKKQKIDKTKYWFYENINKIDKTLARLTKKDIKISNK